MQTIATSSEHLLHTRCGSKRSGAVAFSLPAWGVSKATPLALWRLSQLPQLQSPTQLGSQMGISSPQCNHMLRAEKSGRQEIK